MSWQRDKEFAGDQFMNYSDVQSLRLVVYACQDPTLPLEPRWYGVAEVHAALNHGCMKTLVIKSETRYTTKSAAIEAAHKKMMRQLMDRSAAMPTQVPTMKSQEERALTSGSACHL